VSNVYLKMLQIILKDLIVLSQPQCGVHTVLQFAGFASIICQALSYLGQKIAN